MDWFLPRGYVVLNENRIKRVIAEGNDWQIYLTNFDSYVLAVKPCLYEKWVSDYSLPVNVFKYYIDNDLYIYLSSNNYIVSSLQLGPFPDTSGQVEAFSIAFKTATDLFPNTNLCNAVYIEEFSLILPTMCDDLQLDNHVVYGKWLTGGVNISIDSFERISKIMSWLPKNELIKSSQLAGFEIADFPCENAEIADETEVPAETSGNVIYNKPKEEFSLIGRPDLERFFNENIIDIVLHQEQYQRMGISFPGATILYGPPGCGKTYAIERLSEYLGWQRFDIDSSTIASSYIHDTSKKISEIFQAAIKAAPSILVIDEMEAFLTDRGMAGSSGTYHIEEVAEFLRRIPEAISKGVLVFAMTNMIDSIDSAILRRGRFDHIIEVGMATKDEIAAYLSVKFKGLPVAKEVAAENIASKLDGHPFSDIAFVLREAGRIAVKENKESIDQFCIDEVLGMLSNRDSNRDKRRKIGFVQ